MKLCMGCMTMYEDNFDICPYCGYEENSLPEEAFHLIPGTEIGERYIVGKVLGFGGFGVTYIGYDKELEKKVAIKEYLPSEFATRTLHQTRVTVYGGEKTEQFGLGMEKFVDEARKLAQFSEDTEIVNVYDTFTENDTAYIIMEYLVGENLKQLLERKGKLSLEEAERIIIPIYRSLKNIHDAGIIHRDIAPDNIFITKEGRVKLLDFGAARYASATHSRSLTVIYKPGYAPEEQYQSRGEQGPWTDVYALSATLYKCITGVTPDTSLERKVKDTLKEPSKLGINIPKNKETALMNALNIQVESRTKSTEEFLKEWESKSEVVRIVEKIKTMDVGHLSKKARVGIIAGIVALAAGIAVVIGLGGVSKITDSIKIAHGNVRVPSVVNETFDDAVQITENAGVHMMQEDTKYDALIEKGKVLTQSVEAGQLMSASDSLMVIVSGGIRQIYVPEIVGSKQEVALSALVQEGFTYCVIEEYSSMAIGNIIRTNYSAGTQCDEGTEVVVYVSKGIDPSTIEEPDEDDELIEYVVEDYTNMTVEEVSNILVQYGIYLDYSEQVESEVVEKDCVASQLTSVGTVLTAGETVYVVMSTGVPMVNVGDIIGWQFEDRKAALEESGLFLEKGEERYDNNKASGLILSVKTESGEDVTDGDMLKKGTKVICVVSKGPEPTAVKKATNTPKPTPTKKPKATPTNTPKPTPTKKPKATPTNTPKPTPTNTPIPTVHFHNYKRVSCYLEKCTSCGAEKTTTNHIPGAAATCTSEQKCTACGTVIQGKKAHTPGAAATCKEAQKCTVCGTVIQEKKAHTPGVAATCTEDQKCTVCSTVIQKAKGHTPGAVATCKEAQKCTVCSTVIQEKKAHTSGAAANCTEDQKCTVCSAVIKKATGHKYTQGTDIKCSVCNTILGYYEYGEWSAWQDTRRDYDFSREEEDTPRQVYKYNRYYGYYKEGDYYLGLGYSSGICTTYEETVWLDEQMPWDKEWSKAQNRYNEGYGYGYTRDGKPGSEKKIFWYNEKTKTQYRYRTKKIVYY